MAVAPTSNSVPNVSRLDLALPPQKTWITFSSVPRYFWSTTFNVAVTSCRNRLDEDPGLSKDRLYAGGRFSKAFSRCHTEMFHHKVRSVANTKYTGVSLYPLPRWGVSLATDRQPRACVFPILPYFLEVPLVRVSFRKLATGPNFYNKRGDHWWNSGTHLDTRSPAQPQCCFKMRWLLTLCWDRSKCYHINSSYTPLSHCEWRVQVNVWWETNATGGHWTWGSKSCIPIYPRAAFSRKLLSPDAQGERECSLNNKLTIFWQVVPERVVHPRSSSLFWMETHGNHQPHPGSQRNTWTSRGRACWCLASRSWFTLGSSP